MHQKVARNIKNQFKSSRIVFFGLSVFFWENRASFLTLSCTFSVKIEKMEGKSKNVLQSIIGDIAARNLLHFSNCFLTNRGKFDWVVIKVSPGIFL